MLNITSILKYSENDVMKIRHLWEIRCEARLRANEAKSAHYAGRAANNSKESRMHTRYKWDCTLTKWETANNNWREAIYNKYGAVTIDWTNEGAFVAGLEFLY
jgi:hypothetical protein